MTRTALSLPRTGIALLPRRFEPRTVLWLGCLICVLIAQGVAITESYLWAIPLICLLLVVVAVDIPLVPLVGLTLLVRVLTDDLTSAASRHSASLNPSALIAVLFILIAIGLLIRRRQGLLPVLAIGLCLCMWTAIAALDSGASTVVIREGVREMSIFALAVIAYNSRGALNTSIVTRLIQLAGIAAAILALYQLATHTGLLVGGDIRANGTFAHPNGAALYFAVAAMASLWQYTDNGRRRIDILLTIIYGVATIATFSLSSFFCLLVMITAFGVLRSGSRRLKLGACALVGLLTIGFLATPLGAERIAKESSTDLSAAQSQRGSTNSLEWRLYKWQTLIPQWEQAPLFGQGLGKTVTAEATLTDTTVGNLPHSEYVRYLVETGALGIIALFGGMVLLVRRLRQQRKLPGSRNTATLGLAVIIGLLVNASAANTLLYTPAAYAAALIVTTALMPLLFNVERR